MRRDTRPLWMKRAYQAYEAWWTRRFLAPQFESLGPHPFIIRPWDVEVFGTGVTAGEHLNIIGMPDHKVRLTLWPGPDQDAEIKIGNAVLLVGGSRLLAARSVTLGDGCMLAREATVTDCDWHGLYDRVTANAEASPVVLKNNVWVGDGAYVGKGVTIGENSVVAARAVVTEDVPANTVVGGIPAKKVKDLDPDGPFRTRMDMFADLDAYRSFFLAMDQQKMGANTSLDWLRSKIAPTKHD